MGLFLWHGAFADAGRSRQDAGVHTSLVVVLDASAITADGRACEHVRNLDVIREAIAIAAGNPAGGYRIVIAYAALLVT